jgi:hypothetical protein
VRGVIVQTPHAARFAGRGDSTRAAIRFHRSRAVVSCAALAFTACSSTPKPTYDERLATARERLAAVARAEADANPSDADLRCFEIILKGKEVDAVHAETIARTFLGARQLVEAVLFGVLGRPFTPPDPDEADIVIEHYAGIAPASPDLPLYRLRRILLTARDQEVFWGDAAECLREASSLPCGASPTDAFRLRFLEWMEAHEKDPFVVASIDLWLKFPHLIVLKDLANITQGAVLAPAPTRPAVARLAASLRQFAESRVNGVHDLMDYMVFMVAWEIALKAEFRVHFRAGRFKEAEEIAAAYDECLVLKEAMKSFTPGYLKKHEAEIWMQQQVMERVFTPLLGTMREKMTAGAQSGDEKCGTDETAKEMEKLTSDIKEAIADRALVEEGHRRIEEVAQQIIRLRRDELTRCEPFVKCLETFQPAKPKRPNALRWALQDRALLNGSAVPAERDADLIARIRAGETYDFGDEPAGLEVYRALLLDVVGNLAAIPESRIQPFLDSPAVSSELDRVAVLLARGREVAASEVAQAVERAKVLLDQDSWGFCRILARRAKDDPKSAAAMLPECRRDVPDGVETLLSETLRGATGKDLGLNLAAWRTWLLARER